MKYKDIDSKVFELLHKGTVIPAHPLALDASRQLDEHRQRLLTRYYVNAGAGGVLSDGACARARRADLHRNAAHARGPDTPIRVPRCGALYVRVRDRSRHADAGY